MKGVYGARVRVVLIRRCYNTNSSVIVEYVVVDYELQSAFTYLYDAVRSIHAPSLSLLLNEDIVDATVTWVRVLSRCLWRVGRVLEVRFLRSMSVCEVVGIGGGGGGGGAGSGRLELLIMLILSGTCCSCCG